MQNLLSATLIVKNSILSHIVLTMLQIIEGTLLENDAISSWKPDFDEMIPPYSTSCERQLKSISMFRNGCSTDGDRYQCKLFVNVSLYGLLVDITWQLHCIRWYMRLCVKAKVKPLYCIEQWPETCEFITRTIELWNGGLDCHVITTEYRTRVHCIYMYHLFCNALVHAINSGVSGQCSYTIQNDQIS